MGTTCAANNLISINLMFIRNQEVQENAGKYNQPKK